MQKYDQPSVSEWLMVSKMQEPLLKTTKYDEEEKDCEWSCC